MSAVVISLLFVCVPTVANGNENPILTRYLKFQETYEKRVESIAKWCEENDMPTQAQKTRDLLRGTFSGDKIYVAELPKEILDDTPPARASAKSSKSTKKKKSSSKKESASDSEKDASSFDGVANLEEEWEAKIKDLKDEAAGYLFTLAKRAVKMGYAGFGFDLLMRALQENPDHLAARKILGYKKFKNQWLTDFEISQYKAGKVYHERFGWLPKGQVKRYENGERFFNGKWISAEEDAQYHANIENGWIVETPNYIIVTNHSIEAGVKIGNELEKLHRVWKQLFMRYCFTELQVNLLFEGKGSAAIPGQKHKVCYFKTRQNYIECLQAQNPNIASSAGMYSPRYRTAYFFADEQFDIRTMYHEATHQLFDETRKTDPKAGVDSNFWIIEGIAVFMESLKDTDGFHTVGGYDDQRMIIARYRYNLQQYYIPLEQMSKMKIKAFQNHPEVSKLYSQSAALVHFMVYYDNGKYRDALVAVLFDVYTGKSNDQTIPKYLGKSYSELDKEFGMFISQKTEELKNWRIE
ncbi:MAG: DUF1570 domain-containing protein [Planctomycetia bacterium]|nr:DUF1570 domain-containing protein [Planctomycetia bacterium]